MCLKIQKHYLNPDEMNHLEDYITKIIGEDEEVEVYKFSIKNLVIFCTSVIVIFVLAFIIVKVLFV